MKLSVERVAEAIRRRRKRLGWNQQRLAEKIGVEVGGITRLEKGDGNPSFRLVLAALEALGVDPREVVELVVSRLNDGIEDGADRERIGEALRLRRKGAGWSQKDLSEMMGSAAYTVQRLEDGDIENQKFGTVLAAAAALGTGPLEVLHFFLGHREAGAEEEPRSIGEALRLRRERLGVARDLTAKRAGVGAVALARLESGETKDPAFGMVIDVHEALGGAPRDLVRLLGGGVAGDGYVTLSAREYDRLMGLLGDLENLRAGLLAQRGSPHPRDPGHRPENP